MSKMQESSKFAKFNIQAVEVIDGDALRRKFNESFMQNDDVIRAQVADRMRQDIFKFLQGPLKFLRPIF
ncbi:hypothetical protein [Pseudophaeobacter sp. EL27]|uniref:hypothetical protein n=1 Tax=Pseudophaeobacter sp. EL27 TaxID=2107580 RepID=UPI000EFD9AB4|nr:hypothetical protein [Pseudophaeobacter sp. EL27]